MKKIVISSDTTCDLPQNIIEKNEIALCPITILLGTEEHRDTIDIDANGVLAYVEKTNTLPKTSATGIYAYKEYFEKLLEDNEQVIHFCISSKASSCYSNATKAAEELKNVFVVDSYSLSSGQGIQVLKACDLLKEGKTAEEIIAEIDANRDKSQISFVVDRLDFLHKGGRCSSVAMAASKVLKIHPAVAISDGALGVKKKYMGNMVRCLTQYVKDIAEENPNYDPKRCFITHSPSDKELVDLVTDSVKNLFKFDEVIDTTAGSTVTSHCGYNTIGVIFYNK
mgnify:FL=1